MTDFELKKIRDFGGIISDTFTYVRLHYKTYGLAVLYYVLPILILAAIIIGVGYADFFTEAIQSRSDEPPIEETLGFLGQIFFGLLLLGVSMGMLSLVTFTHLKLTRDGASDITAHQLTQNAVSKLFGLLAIYLVTGIAVAIGFFIFILPGIFIAMRLLLAPSIYIIEDISVGDALSRSWELVEDYWWFTFGLFIVMIIIGYLISTSLTVPMMIIGMFAAFAGSADGGSIGTIVGIMYGLIIAISYVFQMIPLLSYSLHYFNLVERKEGSGLRARIETLDNVDV